MSIHVSGRHSWIDQEARGGKMVPCAFVLLSLMYQIYVTGLYDLCIWGTLEQIMYEVRAGALKHMLMCCMWYMLYVCLIILLLLLLLHVAGSLRAL